MKATYEIMHPTKEEAITAEFDDTGTPGQLLEQLQEQGWLKPPAKGDYCLVPVKDEKTQLTNHDSFAGQGVGDGAELKVRVRAGGAAPRRGPTKERLIFDYRSLLSISGKGCVQHVTPYADRQMKSPITSENQAHRLRRYVVDFNLPIPVDTRSTASTWKVVFDLEPGWTNYPSAAHAPCVDFLGRKPWHYRVSRSGHLCTNPVGSAGFVAGQHVGMIAGLLNADEPFDLPHDTGYDSSCYRFYRDHFKGPVTPGLEIPEVDKRIFMGEPDVIKPAVAIVSRGVATTVPQLTFEVTASSLGAPKLSYQTK